MKRFPLLGVTLGAVLVVSAWMSASASAACKSCWHVKEGAKASEELAAGKFYSLQGKQTGSFVLTGKALGFIELSVTCKKMATSGGKLLGGEPGKIEATLTFRECTSNSGLCTPSEPIKSPVKGEIVRSTSAGRKYLGVVFESKEKSGVFTEIECSGLGLGAAVTGEIMAELGEELGAKIEVGKELEQKEEIVNFPGTTSEKYENVKGETLDAELKWEGTVATLKGQSVNTLEPGIPGEKVLFGAFD
jgi:hypothetical protein